jgi:uncharacterized protein involved in exopolysaccharide biosynthesis
MQNLLNSKPGDQIDLRELLSTLWAYKLLIAITCALSIFTAGYFIRHMDKKFTSTAIFKLSKKNSVGAFSEQLGTLAGFAGFGGRNDDSLSADYVNGRIFIEKLDAKLNFQADPYFNSYKPNSVDPIWKSIIKRATGWKKSSADIQENIWQRIDYTYTRNVTFKQTPDKSTKIIVTHVNPERAAEIANEIMNYIISSSKLKSNTEQDLQLNYLSNTLANALNELEISTNNLKEFKLENSSLPLENFKAGSFKLDVYREQLSRTSELYDAVAALSLIVKNKTKNQSNYLSLRKKFPIVDQVEFRRILGQNEIISSWNWPEASSINAILDTLLERKSRLETQINTSQLEAERLGQEVETYAKLQRDAKIAEASYTVLIEQVKAQSMAAGYRPDRTEIYEYATTPISPTSPNRNLILSLGAILGLISGAALSLALALPRDVFFSKTSLKNESQARITASIKSLLPLRNKSLSELNSNLAKKPRSTLRELAVEINKNATTMVVITSSRAKMTSIGVARAVSSYMQSENMKIAVIDFSSKARKLDIDDKQLSISSFIIAESIGQLSVLVPDGDLEAVDMLSQREFWEHTLSLNSTFDLIFMCADNNNAISLLNALEGKKILHISLARTKKTKSATLAQMRSLLPIQGLLHD